MACPGFLNIQQRRPKAETPAGLANARLALAIGFLCRIGGEALGAEFLFRQWRDLAFMTRYWGQVKAQGLSINDVRRLMEL